MDTPSITASQAVFDIQILRRRALPSQVFLLWPVELKLHLKQAEERLASINGLDLAKALIEYGISTGQRVRI